MRSSTKDVNEIARAWEAPLPDGDIDAKRLTLKLLLIAMAINRESETWCRQHCDLGWGKWRC